jgi:hypothetical protein
MLGKGPKAAAELCNSPPEEAAVEFEGLAAQAHAAGSIAKQEVQHGPQLAQNLVESIPIVGSLASIMFGIVGWLGKTIVSRREWGCHKNCKRYDARNLINLCPPPVGFYQDNMHTLVWAMHDGLVVDGVNKAGGVGSLGRQNGVFGYHEPGCDKPRIMDNASERNEQRRRHRQAWMNYDVPKGNASKPWREKGNNWYWRSYRVGQLLRWLERKMPCNILMCAAKTFYSMERQSNQAISMAMYGLTQDDAAYYDLSEDQRKELYKARHHHAMQNGSRWYASIYWMHRDIWTMAQQLPVDEVVRIATENGCGDFANAYRARVSRDWKPEELIKEPWPGFSATTTLSWGCAQKLIPVLSDAVMKNLPRLMWSPEKRAQFARLLTMGRRQPGVKTAVPARMQRVAAIVRAQRLQDAHLEEEPETERTVDLSGYALPIGLGVVALVTIGGLYWYAKRREEQQVVQNLPAWEDDE